MLVDEAKLSVQLEHPHIVHTFDLGRVGKQYYIAMELIDGPDLYRLLRTAANKERAFPIAVAAHIAHSVASALHYAHEKNDPQGRHLQIVHRDVSPQNVLISVSGDVKLVDFGIAKAALRNQHTAAGVIKGKYYYMSPEQAWGDAVDRRSDVFSTGILLYEMIVGRMLYMKEDIHELLDMVRRADIVPPSQYREGVPPELDAIVMRALGKKAEDRYQTAAEFADALAQLLSELTPQFAPNQLTEFVNDIIGDEHTVKGAERQFQTAAHRSQVDFDDNSVIFDLHGAQGRSAAEGFLDTGRARDRDEPTAAGGPIGFVASKTDFTDTDATFVEDTRSRPMPKSEERAGAFKSTQPLKPRYDPDRTTLDLATPNLSEHTTKPSEKISGTSPVVVRSSGSHTSPLVKSAGLPDTLTPTPTPRPHPARDTPRPSASRDTPKVSASRDTPRPSAARDTPRSGLAKLPTQPVQTRSRAADAARLVDRAQHDRGPRRVCARVLHRVGTQLEDRAVCKLGAARRRSATRWRDVAEPHADGSSRHRLAPSARVAPLAARLRCVANRAALRGSRARRARAGGAHSDRGTLTVQSTPSGAELIINGRSSGATPMTVSELPPNESVEIELRLRGYKPRAARSRGTASASSTWRCRSKKPTSGGAARCALAASRRTR